MDDVGKEMEFYQEAGAWRGHQSSRTPRMHRTNPNQSRLPPTLCYLPSLLKSEFPSFCPF